MICSPIPIQANIYCNFVISISADFLSVVSTGKKNVYKKIPVKKIHYKKGLYKKVPL